MLLLFFLYIKYFYLKKTAEKEKIDNRRFFIIYELILITN